MLFIEGAAGMSGDMTVGALLSLGASAERLKETLDSLQLGDEFSYVIAQKSSYGIAGTDFDVILPHHHHGHDGLPRLSPVADGATRGVYRSQRT